MGPVLKRLPIVVDDCGDIDVFQTLEDAESYVEVVDIVNGTAVAFDSEGRLLKGHEERNGLISRGLKLELAEAEPLHAADLRGRLIRCLGTLGEPVVSLEADSLEGLIGRALRIMGPRK